MCDAAGVTVLFLPVDIRHIDLQDEVLTRRFWEVGKAADEVGRPWSPYWSWPAARAAFTTESIARRRVLLAAFDGDDMVGVSEMSLPMLDNPHLAYVEIFVHPGYERQGVGTALTEASASAAGRHGRSILSIEVPTPMNGEESAGLRLARRLGFSTGVVNDMKVVDLPATAHLWQSLLDDTDAAARGYRLRGWTDVCPEDLVPGYCRLLESFNTEAPTGELALDEERWDEARVREKEARFRSSGRHEFGTAALGPDGSVVGVTEVMVSDHAPDRGFQGATLVVRGHRGHRLGLRMKARNHQAVLRAFPGCATLLTGNADVNAHMNAVNDRLGYRPVERVVEMQRAVTPA